MKIETHGSVFTGLGGFDLAAEWMGWNNVFHCEWDPFCNQVLQHYWPNTKKHFNIDDTDFTIYRRAIDILTGGFPCQPYSVAGKKRGTDDDRHKWPQMLRAIREIQPRWVVGENVGGIVSWNNGLVFEQVQTDLEAEGYEVFPVILPACSINAPHRRDRIFFIAHTDKYNDNRALPTKFAETKGSKNINRTFNSHTGQFIGTDPVNQFGGNLNGYERVAANTNDTGRGESNEKIEGQFPEQFDGRGIFETGGNPGGIGLEGGRDAIGTASAKGQIIEPGSSLFRDIWKDFPSQPPVCFGNDGFSLRLDGTTFSKWRNNSLKALGNAVVPGLVLQIFRAIESTEC